jgi:hypothetical protein
MSKNRLKWGMGLMLICGAILIALPWLTTRSNWDRDWDKPTVAPLWKVQAAKYGLGIGDLTFSASGAAVLSRSGEDFLLWDAAMGQKLSQPLKPSGIKASLSRDGSTALSVKPGVVIGTRKHEHWRDKNGRVSPVQTPGTQKLIYNQKLFGNRGIEIWDVPTKKLLRVIPIPNDRPERSIEITDLVLSPDGGRLFLRLRQQYQLWDAHSGQIIWSRTNYKDFYDSPSYLFSTDNKTIYQVISSDERNNETFPELRLVDKRTESIAHTFPIEKGRSEFWVFWRPVVFSSQSQYLIAVRRSTQSGYKISASSNDGQSTVGAHTRRNCCGSSGKRILIQKFCHFRLTTNTSLLAARIIPHGVTLSIRASFLF